MSRKQRKVFVLTKLRNCFDVEFRKYCASMDVAVSVAMSDMYRCMPKFVFTRESEVSEMARTLRSDLMAHGYRRDSYVIEVVTLLER